jgi:hypothetical protein
MRNASLILLMLAAAPLRAAEHTADKRPEPAEQIAHERDALRQENAALKARLRMLESSTSTTSNAILDMTLHTVDVEITAITPADTKAVREKLEARRQELAQAEQALADARARSKDASSNRKVEFTNDPQLGTRSAISRAEARLQLVRAQVRALEQELASADQRVITARRLATGSTLRLSATPSMSELLRSVQVGQRLRVDGYRRSSPQSEVIVVHRVTPLNPNAAASSKPTNTNNPTSTTTTTNSLAAPASPAKAAPKPEHKPPHRN